MNAIAKPELFAPCFPIFELDAESIEADKAHKKQVCDAILAELAKINIDEKTGQDLIKAIYNNQIPNIKITF